MYALCVLIKLFICLFYSFETPSSTMQFDFRPGSSPGISKVAPGKGHVTTSCQCDHTNSARRAASLRPHVIIEKWRSPVNSIKGAPSPPGLVPTWVCKQISNPLRRRFLKRTKMKFSGPCRRHTDMPKSRCLDVYHWGSFKFPPTFPYLQQSKFR